MQTPKPFTRSSEECPPPTPFAGQYKFPHSAPIDIQTFKLATQFRRLALSLFTSRRPSSLYNQFWLESVWDPFDLVHFSPAAGSLSQGARAITGTKVDWVETDEAHIFKADLPGLKKEDIKVELDDDRVLRISGERNQEEEQKGDKWHSVERSYGKFVRRFKLPQNAQTDSVSAKVENGVLTVTVPKTQKTTPETRNIEVA
ncbi:unnamed protein product [Calypogeia fissa]